MNSPLKEITKGILTENPVFVLLLGLCPVLAVTTSLQNGVGMGFAGGAVLICSNVVISSIRKQIPAKIRIPIFIVVIASFVTIVDLSMEAHFPELHTSLGLFIPLIVVNCIILGRAEAFASKNTIFASILDGIGMTVGFTLALALIGGIRELLGSGSLWGVPLHILLGYVPGAGLVVRFGEFMELMPAIIMILPPGAFILMGLLMSFFQFLKARKEAVR